MIVAICFCSGSGGITMNNFPNSSFDSLYSLAALKAILVPKAVFPIEGLPAIIIKSELCNPPSFLSISLSPVGSPAILPSFLYDLSIIFKRNSKF